MDFPKQKILILHSSSDLYGASRVIIESIRALLEEGHKVVFAVSSDGPLCLEVIKLGCKVEIIPLATVRRKYFNVRGLLNRANAFRNSWKEIKMIVSIHKIDTIYSNTTGVIIGCFFAKRNQLRHLWHVHEIIPGPSWLLKAYGFLMHKHANTVVVVSDAVKEYWLEVNSKINIEKLYNGFHFLPYGEENTIRQELGVSSDALLIGMIARVHFWKGQSYFLELSNLIRQKNGNVKFVMVGDAFPGYEYIYEEIKNKVEELDLQDDVIDLGYRTDISRILDGLDIFILPSILPDPLPTTILEAMSASKPVVATNHGGAPEMIADEMSGYLIPWDNAQKAVDIIFPLINDRSLREEMGRKGSEIVADRFSVDQYKKNLIKLVENL
ncbi:MAG: glycosyltransferase involved in cell wall biosynthesis [Arcticibacterium sp.]|jgi:glycosyltransferase involved in cell wall biosynthesis